MIKARFTKNILICLIISILLLIGLTLLFVSAQAQPKQQDNPVLTPPARKTVNIAGKDLSDTSVYSLTMKIKKLFILNPNLDVKITDKPANKSDINIFCDKDSVNVTSNKGEQYFYYSERTTSTLITQYLFANLYLDSAIAIVGDYDELQKLLLENITYLVKKNGRQMNISQFKTDVNPDKLADFNAVVLLNDKNNLLLSLNSIGYSGLRIAVSGNEDMLTLIQDAKLSALIFKNQDELSVQVANAALALLKEEKNLKTEVFQQLLNIYNINEYLVRK